MPPDVTETNAGNMPEAPKSAGKVKLLTLENMDKRGAAYRRTVELIGRVERDLGGSGRLSSAQKQLIRSAGLTAAMLEHLGSQWLEGQPIDPVTFSTLANCARRLFETVGLQRVPREVAPTVAQYLGQERAP
jgi:hypothetical protein